MSLAGLRTIRGSTVTIKRATETQKDEADVALSWAVVATAVAMRIEPLGLRYQKALEREYGTDIKAERLGYGDVAQDLKEKDGIIVTDGKYAGDHLKVLTVQNMGGQLEVVLQLTGETFA